MLKLMVCAEGTLRTPDNVAAWYPLASLEPVPLGGKKLDGTLNGKLTVYVPVFVTLLFSAGLHQVSSPPAVTSCGKGAAVKQFERQPNAAVFKTGRPLGPRCA